MSKSDKIDAYLMRVDSAGTVYAGYMTEVENSLEAEQRYVEGLIEVISLGDVDIIFNEEGKLKQLPANRCFVDDDGNVLDIIAGNIMCVRHDEEGMFTSILEQDIKVIEQYLRPIEQVVLNVIPSEPNKSLPQWSAELGDCNNYD